MWECKLARVNSGTNDGTGQKFVLEFSIGSFYSLLLRFDPNHSQKRPNVYHQQMYVLFSLPYDSVLFFPKWQCTIPEGALHCRFLSPWVIPRKICQSDWESTFLHSLGTFDRGWEEIPASFVTTSDLPTRFLLHFNVCVYFVDQTIQIKQNF